MNACNNVVCNLINKQNHYFWRYKCKRTHPLYKNHDIYGKMFVGIMFYFSDKPPAALWYKFVVL